MGEIILLVTLAGGAFAFAVLRSSKKRKALTSTRATATRYREPPNRYIPAPGIDLEKWKRAVQKELAKDGVNPDATLFCYGQASGDRVNTVMEYVDVGIGVFKKHGFLRFVTGENDKPEEGVHSHDVKFDDVKLIILRKRSTPRWQQPTPDKDGTYPFYDFYYQTRVYTPTTASYAPKHVESRTRLIDAPYVFDWLREHTGALCAKDTQEEPLDGYPEGV